MLNKANNTATRVATTAASTAAATAVSAVAAPGSASPPAAAPGTAAPAAPAPVLPPMPTGPVSSATGALEPIAGITLERYAELAAKMAEANNDLEVCAQIAAQNGVDRPTWEAAMAGWNARMNDPATAAEVALAYMPLYQQALSVHGGPRATATLDEYLEMLAMINTDLKEGDVRPVPFEPMYARFGISAPKWSQISTAWVEGLNQDPALGADFGDRFVARIKELDDLWLATHTLPW
jgi:hypothetical protein